MKRWLASLCLLATLCAAPVAAQVVIIAQPSGGGVGGAGNPAGADTQVQYNDLGVFGGDPGMTFNETTNVLTVTGSVTSPTFTGALAGTASTATALAANGANCSSGSAPLGVDASGAVEACFDATTQTEFDAHVNDTTAAHAASAIGVTPFGTVAATDVQTALQEIVTETTGPGGSTTQVQYNNAGAFGGDSGLTFNSTTDVLTAVGGFVGPLTGNVTGNVTGSSGSTTGNAATATALAANGANCGAGQAPLGVSASGVVESCFDVATQTEIDAHLNDTTAAHAASAIAVTPFAGIAATDVQAALEEIVAEVGGGGGTPGGLSTQVQFNDGGVFGGDAGLTYNKTTDVLTATGGFVGNASTATALAANGANCSAGQVPIGVDASGAVEGCVDVGTQTELDAHINDTTAAHAASAIGVTPVGAVAADDVQEAIQELDTEKIAVALIDANLGVPGLTSTGQLKPAAMMNPKSHAALAAGTTVNWSTGSAVVVYVEGSGGAVTSTASPRIEAGTKDGQLLWVCGSHATNTWTMPTGAGTYLRGNTGSIVFGKDNGCVPFIWSSATSLWHEGIGLSLEDAARKGRTIQAGASNPVKVGDITGDDYVGIFTDSGVPKIIAYCNGSPCPNSSVTLGVGGDFDIFNSSSVSKFNLDNDTGNVTIANNLTVTGSWKGPGAPVNSMCQVIDAVTSADDNRLFNAFSRATLITGVYCNYQGAAPTTAATFTLEDGSGNAMTITGTNPTCAAPGSAATVATVTAGNALTVREVLRFDTTNTPNPATDTYMLCVTYEVTD